MFGPGKPLRPSVMFLRKAGAYPGGAKSLVFLQSSASGAPPLPSGEKGEGSAGAALSPQGGGAGHRADRELRGSNCLSAPLSGRFLALPTNIINQGWKCLTGTNTLLASLAPFLLQALIFIFYSAIFSWEMIEVYAENEQPNFSVINKWQWEKNWHKEDWWCRSIEINIKTYIRVNWVWDNWTFCRWSCNARMGSKIFSIHS